MINLKLGMSLGTIKILIQLGSWISQKNRKFSKIGKNL
jgi:hypothetical protein